MLCCISFFIFQVGVVSGQEVMFFFVCFYFFKGQTRRLSLRGVLLTFSLLVAVPPSRARSPRLSAAPLASRSLKSARTRLLPPCHPPPTPVTPSLCVARL